MTSSLRFWAFCHHKADLDRIIAFDGQDYRLEIVDDAEYCKGIGCKRENVEGHWDIKGYIDK